MQNNGICCKRSACTAYLVFKGLISKHQHAFIKNHSMATNVLESINDWLVGLKAPSRTDVVYIDFSKAFNSIIVAKLIAKLECYGISGLLLSHGLNVSLGQNSMCYRQPMSVAFL
jgi:hypothetical protein